MERKRLHRPLFFIFVTGAAAVAVACGHVYSSGTPSDAGVEAGLEAASPAPSDAAPFVPCPTGCLTTAPAGWTGPSAIFEGNLDAGVTCPVFFPEAGVETMLVDAASLDCVCDRPNVTGGGCAFIVQVYPTTACVGTPTFGHGGVMGFCAQRQEGDTVAFTEDGGLFLDTPGTAASCAPPNPPTIPPLVKTAIATCDTREVTACPARADCVTIATPLQAPFTRVCIHRAGDVACPSPDFPNRFVAARGYDDTRKCTACSASFPANPCPLDVGSCDDLDAAPTPYDGGCQALPTTGSVSLGGPLDKVDTPTCDVEAGAPSGTLTTTGPETYCCAN